MFPLETPTNSLQNDNLRKSNKISLKGISNENSIDTYFFIRFYYCNNPSGHCYYEQIFKERYCQLWKVFSNEFHRSCWCCLFASSSGPWVFRKRHDTFMRWLSKKFPHTFFVCFIPFSYKKLPEPPSNNSKTSIKYLQLTQNLWCVPFHSRRQQKQQEIKLNSGILDLLFFLSYTLTLIFLVAPLQNQPSHFSMQILIAPSTINVLPSGEIWTRPRRLPFGILLRCNWNLMREKWNFLREKWFSSMITKFPYGHVS